MIRPLGPKSLQKFRWFFGRFEDTKIPFEINWPLVLRDSIYDHGKRKARVVARKLAKDLFTHVRSPTYFFLLKASLMMLYLTLFGTRFSSTKFRVKTTFMRLNVQWNCLKFTSYQKFRQTIAWRNLWLANLAPNLSTCQIKKNVKSQCVKISLLKRQDLVVTFHIRVRTWN